MKNSLKFYHPDVFLEFPDVNPKKNKPWKSYDHLIALALFFMSVGDLVVDITLAWLYDQGRTYEHNLHNSNHHCKKGSHLLFKNTDGSYRCSDHYYAELTILAILLPSPHITSVIFHKGPASVMNIVWGFIFALLGSVPIILNKGESEKSSFDLLSILVPLGLYSVVWGFVSFGFAAHDNEAIPTCDNILLWTKKILIFPFVYLLSPIVSLVVSFRAIFPHNDVFRRVLMDCKFIECFNECSTQLCLQIFIIMKDYQIPITRDTKSKILQILSVTCGILTVAIPAMEKHLQHKPYTFKNYFKFYPIFTFNTVFRILTWSIIFYFFYFFYGVVTLLCYMGFLAFTNLFLVKVRFPKMVEDEEAWNDYKLQLGEMTVQSFLTIPNLQDTPAARFCRKFSFYASLFFNLSILLIFMILCNLGVHLEFDCRPFFGTGESSDCKINIPEDIKDIKNFNTHCLVVMSIGAFSLMLDIILKNSAVFNAPDSSSHLSNPVKTSEKSNENQHGNSVIN